MKAFVAILIIIVLVFLIPTFKINVVNATTSKVYATDDATVKKALPSSNFGQDQQCDVYNYINTNNEAHAYLRYDYNSIMPKIESATFHFAIYFYGDADGATLSLYYCSSDSWSENTITWNNKPAYGSCIATKVLTAGIITALEEGGVTASSIYSTVWEADISTLVKSETDKKLSFVLVLNYGTAWLFSQENVEGRGLSNYLSINHHDFEGYADLSTFDFDNLASSLKVRGTAIMFDGKTYTGDSKYYPQDIDVPSLNAIGWNDKASSLKVDGSITLYEHDNYGGRTVTFVSTSDPNENLGYLWGTNPNLIKSQGKYESRVWGWDTSYLELLGPDSENYMNWVSDGLVSAQCKDSITRSRWGVCNFDQGYSMDQRWISDLKASGQTDSGYFGDYVRSLKLQGTVTLYENVNYGGASITLGPFSGVQGWISDLTAYGWSHTTRSIHLYNGSTLTVYALPNYVHAPDHGFGMLTFATPSYQPMLRIGDQQSITLEASVKDWYTDGLTYGSCSWTGAKFDVWAVESPTRAFSGRKLMLELYFLRMGMNLWWGNAIAKPGLNKMVAIDCYPESVQRTVHPGGIQRWKVDLLRFLVDCAGDYGIDIWSWYIAQVSFDVESGSSLPYCESPICRCSLTKFRVCYKPYPGGGGGGCPYLNTWDGKQYVNEGLLDIHDAEGNDVFATHTLTTTPKKVYRDFQFRLVEHQQTISNIDQVRLFAALKNGKLVELPLVYAVHSEYGNVLPELIASDNLRIEERGANWNKGVSQSISLSFRALSSSAKVQSFIFVIEGSNMFVKV
jgi:hypothetical protein